MNRGKQDFPKQPVNIMLDYDTKEKLRQVAYFKRKSQSRIVREALGMYFDNLPKNESR